MSNRGLKPEVLVNFEKLYVCVKCGKLCDEIWGNPIREDEFVLLVNEIAATQYGVMEFRWGEKRESLLQKVPSLAFEAKIHGRKLACDLSVDERDRLTMVTLHLLNAVKCLPGSLSQLYGKPTGYEHMGTHELIRHEPFGVSVTWNLRSNGMVTIQFRSTL